MLRKIRLRFSLRTLLGLILAFALGMTLVVTPRLEHKRLWQQFITHPNIEVSYADFEDYRNTLDRWFGITEIYALDVVLKPSTPNGRLAPELMELAANFSPLDILKIENAQVEPARNYPAVHFQIELSELTGEHLDKWLAGLIHAQSRLGDFTAFAISGMSDKHVEQLCQIHPLENISLHKVPVTGTGFHTLTNRNKKLDLFLEDCPISDAGLATIASKSSSIGYLEIIIKDCDAVPDLSLFLQAHPGFQLNLRIAKDCIDEKTEATLKQLEAYFPNGHIYRTDPD